MILLQLPLSRFKFQKKRNHARGGRRYNDLTFQFLSRVLLVHFCLTTILLLLYLDDSSCMFVVFFCWGPGPCWFILFSHRLMQNARSSCHLQNNQSVRVCCRRRTLPHTKSTSFCTSGVLVRRPSLGLSPALLV